MLEAPPDNPPEARRGRHRPRPQRLWNQHPRLKANQNSPEDDRVQTLDRIDLNPHRRPQPHRGQPRQVLSALPAIQETTPGRPRKVHPRSDNSKSKTQGHVTAKPIPHPPNGNQNEHDPVDTLAGPPRFPFAPICCRTRSTNRVPPGFARRKRIGVGKESGAGLEAWGTGSIDAWPTPLPVLTILRLAPFCCANGFIVDAEQNAVMATEQDILSAAEVIRDGGLVAFPTETVYGLGANAARCRCCRSNL